VPHLEVFSIDDLVARNDLIEFAVFDREHHIAFNTLRVNDANEWDIVNAKTGFRLTHTLGSFMANKTWAWIDRQRPVWLDEFNVDRQTT
jgi:hypothetical protein